MKATTSAAHEPKSQKRMLPETAEEREDRNRLSCRDRNRDSALTETEMELETGTETETDGYLTNVKTI